MKRKKKIPDIALHASLQELTWEAALAAMTGFCTRVAVMMHNGELAYSVKSADELSGLASVAHSLGTRLAAHHLAWASDGSLDIDKLASATAESTSKMTREIAKIGRRAK